MKKTSMFFFIVSILFTSISFETLTAQNTSPYWSLAGNSNAAASSKLGTTNNISLRFLTNNTERMKIDGTGKIGIGITNPVNILTVKSSGSTPAASWLNALNSPIFMGFAEGVSSEFVLAAANTLPGRRSVFQGRRSRGTLTTPLAVVNNDYLTSLLGSGYDGTSFQNPASIDVYVDGVPTTGHVPARISLVTGTNVSDRKERLKVGSTGNFNFNNGQLFLKQSDGSVGIGTTNPSSQLHIVASTQSNALWAEAPYTAIFAIAERFGVSGNSTSVECFECAGVYGSGYEVAIRGEGQGIGVKGTGNFGLYGDGGSIGAYGFGSFSGLYGEAEGEYSRGITGYSASSYGIVAETGNSASYAGYFGGDVFSSGSYVGSDRSLKKDIADVTSAMELIRKLQPKSYIFRQDGNYKLMHLPTGKHYGLIAQDVEQVLPDIVKATTFETGKAIKSAKYEPGAKPANPSDKLPLETIAFKALNYTELIPIMIKALQEQDAKIEALVQLVNRLSQNSTSIKLSNASLGQSLPNPNKNSARITYYIPGDAANAQLTITDMGGKKIKQIQLSRNDNGVVNIDTSNLSAGTYSYALFVDGKLIETKQMVVAK